MNEISLVEIHFPSPSFFFFSVTIDYTLIILSIRKYYIGKPFIWIYVYCDTKINFFMNWMKVVKLEKKKKKKKRRKRRRNRPSFVFSSPAYPKSLQWQKGNPSLKTRFQVSSFKRLFFYIYIVNKILIFDVVLSWGLIFCLLPFHFWFCL